MIIFIVGFRFGISRFATLIFGGGRVMLHEICDAEQNNFQMSVDPLIGVEVRSECVVVLDSFFSCVFFFEVVQWCRQAGMHLRLFCVVLQQ